MKSPLDSTGGKSEKKEADEKKKETLNQVKEEGGNSYTLPQALTHPHILLHANSKPQTPNKNISFHLGGTKTTKKHIYKETRRICGSWEASQEKKIFNLKHKGIIYSPPQTSWAVNEMWPSPCSLGSIHLRFTKLLFITWFNYRSSLSSPWNTKQPPVWHRPGTYPSFRCHQEPVLPPEGLFSATLAPDSWRKRSAIPSSPASDGKFN